MLKFVFKANSISLELLHKDGKVERDDCFLVSVRQHQRPAHLNIFFFGSNMSLVSHCLFHFSGIGVPIMLAYVYGVVPISLCRSGGCGVSAGNGKGVRIEFDDENDMNVGSGTAATGKLQCPHLHPPLPTLTPKSHPVCFCPRQQTTEFAVC